MVVFFTLRRSTTGTANSVGFVGVQVTSPATAVRAMAAQERRSRSGHLEARR